MTAHDTNTTLSMHDELALLRQRVAELEHELLHGRPAKETNGFWHGNGNGHASGSPTLHAQVQQLQDELADLRQSHTLLRGVIDNSQYFVMVRDRAGQFVLVNQALVDGTGLSEGKLLGGSNELFFPPELLDQDNADLDEVFSTGQPTRREVTLNMPDGEHTYLSTKFPLYDQDGTIYAVGDISMDITTQKQATQDDAQRRMVSLIENSSEFIGIASFEGQALYANTAGRAMVGLEDDEDFVKTRVPDYFPPDEQEYLQQEVLPTVMQHGRWEGEMHFQHFKTGELVPVYFNFFVINDHQTGEPLALGTVTRNISEQKRLQQEIVQANAELEQRVQERTAELRQSQELLQGVIASVPSVVYVRDTDWRFTLVNQTHAAIMGTTPDQVVGKTDYELFPDEVVQHWRAGDNEVLATGKPVQTEDYVPMADGLHTYLSTKFPIFDTDGNIYAVGGISTDITERKRAEEQVRQSQTLLRGIIDNMPATVYVKDLDGRYTLINKYAANLVHSDESQIVGKTTAELFPPDVATEWQQRDVQVLATHQPVIGEDTFPGEDGTQTFQTQMFPIFDDQSTISAIGGISINVTERKQAEQEIQSTKARLQHLLASSPVVIYSCKASGDFGATFISENVAQIFPGYQPDDFTNDSKFWASHIHPEDAPRILENLPHIFEHGHHTHEYRFQLKDGTYRWVHDQLRLVYDENGTPVEMIGSWQDITEQKQAAEEQQTLAALVENSSDFIGVAGFDGKAIYLNAYGRQMVGLESEEAFQQSVMNDYTFPEDIPYFQEEVLPALQTEGRWEGELRFRHFETGEPIPVHYSAFIVKDRQSGQPIALGTVTRNLTEQKKAEENLRIFKTMVETSPHGFAVAGVDSVITYSNPAFCALSGQADGLIGRSFVELYAEKDHPDIIALAERIAVDGLWQGELTIQNPDRGSIPIQMTSSIIYDNDGQQKAFSGLFQDLTEQKRAEQERLELQERIIQAQRDALRELSTPLIPISDKVLVMPLVGSIDTLRAQQVMETLLEGINTQQANVAILDITGVQVIDTQVANALIQAAQAVKMLGAQVVLTGIQPRIAYTLVQLGVDLSHMTTRGTLQAGIEFALRKRLS